MARTSWNKSAHEKKPAIALLVTAMLLLTGAVAAAEVTPVQKVSDSKSKFDGAAFGGETVELEEPLQGLELFRVFERASTGFSSVQSVRQDVEAIADKYCKKKSAVARVVTEIHSKSPHILGNFPRVELQFQCVPTALNAVSPEPIKAPEASTDKYERIAAIKRLLDSGALTQQEFETEKSKILSEP